MLKVMVGVALVLCACGDGARISQADARWPSVDVGMSDLPAVAGSDARPVDAIAEAEAGPYPFDVRGGDAKDGAPVDARLPDGSIDAGVDASGPSCGGVPLPTGGVQCMVVTAEVLACFACPHPKTSLCANFCSSSGCYVCSLGKWTRSVVDCFPCIDAAVVDAPYDAGVDVSIDTRDSGGDGSAADGRTD